MRNHDQRLLEERRAGLYFSRLREIIEMHAAGPRERLLRLCECQAEFAVEMLREHPQLFGDSTARLLYLVDRYDIHANLAEENAALDALGRHVELHPEAFVSDATLESALRAVALLITQITAVRADADLYMLYRNARPLQREGVGNQAERIAALRATILHFEEPEQRDSGARRVCVHCRADELGEFRLILWNEWSDLSKLAWPFASVQLFNLVRAEDDPTLWSTSTNSLVVLEPDILIDATEVADCFLHNGTNPWMALLRKFVLTEAGAAMVLGNVVNYLLDDLVAHGPREADDVINEGLRQRLITTLTVFARRPESALELRDLARLHYDNLRDCLRELPLDHADVEPSFAAPRYGLQGRLDLMLAFPDEPQRRDIVELKSGKPQSGAEGIWRNHLAQVACYDLLLDASIPGRRGSSSILYSRAVEHAIRPAPRNASLRREVIVVRNCIVALEYLLANRRAKVLKRLRPGHAGRMPSYAEPDLLGFHTDYSTVGSLERKYFLLFTAFTAREHWAGRLGGERNDGFADLWRRSLSEKVSEMRALAPLAIDPETSDFERLRLRLNFDGRDGRLSTIRRGDVAILTPCPDDPQERREPGILLRVLVREIDQDGVYVSVRSRRVDPNLWTRHAAWALEHDFMGTPFKSMYESLREFMAADLSTRRLILGLEAPRVDPIRTVTVDGLTDQQNEQLARALAARDYYLLQGPPGTGKTSRMLRTLVAQLYDDPSETVAVMAFTNRAVDEICEVLLKAEPPLPFLRLGGIDSTSFPETTLSAQTAESDFETAARLIHSTRILVGTAASMSAQRELMELREFTTAIIDEAAQILEPQIAGLLTRFKRRILIGDEKQMPSVVTQPESGLSVTDAELNAIGLRDLRRSLFERLLERCQAEGWDHAWGAISVQGRMHADLMRWPNERFYGGILRTFADWQNAASVHPGVEIDAATQRPLTRALLEQRLVFMNSGIENGTQIHRSEARAVAEIVKRLAQLLGENFQEQSIGVITPFRTQIAAIRQALGEELADVVRVETVERFQGAERDVIILSTAISHPARLPSMTALNIDGTVDRKLNVAMTRARRQFILVGVEEILQLSPHYADLIRHIRAHGAVFDMP